MKRTTKIPQTNEALQIYSALVQRAYLASRLGSQSFGGARDIFQALGYLKDIRYDDYLARYVRQEIAKAIIDRPVDATWNGPLELDEPGDSEETPLEKEWKALEKKLGLKNKFTRVDKLTGIGCYGVLFLGLDDAATKEEFVNPVKSGKRQLMYVKAFGEKNAQILEFEENPANPRYGLPKMYSITVADSGLGTATRASIVSTMTVNVHYSRIIHIVDDIVESEVFGTPRLEAVFNRLMDLEKITGGDAEMFWRGARPGYGGKLDKDVQATTEFQNSLKAQVDEFEHNLRRILIMDGVELKELAQQIADPSKHVEIQIQMIAAEKGIPKRVLMGSERGELSSAQDADEWNKYVHGRRTDHAEVHIIRPFVDRMIEFGILPEPIEEDKYTVKWADLFALSEAERVKTGALRATAIRDYSANPMSEAFFPLKAFWQYGLGLTPDQIEKVKNMIGDPMQEELKKEMEEMNKLTQPANIKGVPSTKDSTGKETQNNG